MQLELDKTGGHPKWQSRVMLAVRLGVGLSLTLMLVLLARLPVEGAASAVNRMTARQGDEQGLQESVLAMKAHRRDFLANHQASDAAAFDSAATMAQQRLQALKAFSCDGHTPSPADAGHFDTLARLLEAYRAGLGPSGAMAAPGATPAEAASADAAMDHFQEGLLALDRAAQQCLNREVDGFVDKAILARSRALVLIVLMLVAIIGVVWLRRSIQAQMREQLRSSEQLVDAIPLPLSLRSPDGRFVLVNRAFEEKHKVQRAQLLGQLVSDTMSTADAEAIAQMDGRAQATSEPVDEVFHIGTGATQRDVQVRVHALRRPDGHVTGVVGIQTDITALHRKEMQLLETNTRLSQLSLKMIDAQEDERRRIARDLHDQVGQILTALKLQLGSLARHPHIESPATAMVTPIDLAEEALRHTRDLSASLHPHLLDDLGLEPALNWLIERFIRPSVPLIELRCRLDPARGPEAIELVAFRVAQEALTNVVRHAGATRVGVILEAAHGQLTLEVIDDGVGFEAGETWFDLQRSTSLGVTSMRDRVNEVGGELKMESTINNGTSLRVRLPWGTR